MYRISTTCSESGPEGMLFEQLPQWSAWSRSLASGDYFFVVWQRRST